MNRIYSCNIILIVKNAMQIIQLHFQWQSIFFGRPFNIRENFLEECYQLKRHLGVSYYEILMMPVYHRQWFLKRVIRDIQAEEEKLENSGSPNISKNMKSLDEFEKIIAKKQKWNNYLIYK